MATKGAGLSPGPQLMVEIGDMARFTHKGAITVFAETGSGVNDFGDYSQKSVHVSKHGPPVLRKTRFQAMDVRIKIKLYDVVYLFIDRKRAQGKPYYVYMATGASKLLCLLWKGEEISCHPFPVKLTTSYLSFRLAYSDGLIWMHPFQPV